MNTGEWAEAAAGEAAVEAAEGGAREAEAEAEATAPAGHGQGERRRMERENQEVSGEC